MEQTQTAKPDFANNGISFPVAYVDPFAQLVSSLTLKNPYPSAVEDPYRKLSVECKSKSNNKSTTNLNQYKPKILNENKD
jgi:hypothetical protein